MWSKTYNRLYHESSSWKKLTVFPNVVIDPEVATDLLKLNDKNRPINNATLNRYIEDMKNDKWHFTGETISISKTGRLLNGQHRLMAITQSGMPQTFNVQSGLEEGSFAVMDTGRQRTGGDAISMLGYSKGGNISAAIRFVILYGELLQKVSKVIDQKRRVSNEDIAEWTKTHDMQLMVHCSSKSGILYARARFLSPGIFTALYYIMSRKDREKADEFFEILTTGENCSSTVNSAIFVLRSRLINMLSSKMALKNPNDKYALIIKGWNYWREDREVKQLTYNPDIETFPIAI